MMTVEQLQEAFPAYTWSITNPTDTPDTSMFRADKGGKYIAFHFDYDRELDTKGQELVSYKLKELEDALA